jgi:hypothetical protein
MLAGVKAIKRMNSGQVVVSAAALQCSGKVSD